MREVNVRYKEGEMNGLNKTSALFSPRGNYVAITSGTATSVFCEGERVADIRLGGAIAVSDRGSVIFSDGGREVYILSLDGERNYLPPPPYGNLTYCFAAEPLDRLGEDVEQWEINGETVIRLPGRHAEHHPPFLLSVDGNWHTIRYKELVEWSMEGPVGCGAAVFYARGRDVFLFAPPVGIYYCTLPLRIVGIQVGKTMVSALCDHGVVYVFPAVSTLPASYTCVGSGFIGVYWLWGKDALVCASDNAVVVRSFPEYTPPEYYIHEELLLWGKELYTREELNEGECSHHELV